MQKCGKCKHDKPSAGFGRHRKTGQIKKVCIVCTDKQREYNKSPAGKASIHKSNTSQKRKEWKAGWLESDIGKATMARCDEYWKSDERKEYMRQYDADDSNRDRANELRRKPERRAKANATARAWRQTEDGQLSSQESDRRKYEKILADPGKKLQMRLRSKVCQMIQGYRKP